MQRPLKRVVIAAVLVCTVLAPALIWSDQRSQPAKGVAGEDFGFSKEPSVFTLGPPMTAEALAEREMEKRLSLLEAEARAREYIIGGSSPGNRPSPRSANRTSPGSVDGPSLTTAELQKLAAIRRGAFQPREDRSTWPKKLDPKPEKIDVPLRPLGAEGLTPEERAKFEASRELQDKTGADEGGRSR